MESDNTEKEQSQPDLELSSSVGLGFAGSVEYAILHAALLGIKKNPNSRISFANTDDYYNPKFSKEIEDVFNPSSTQKTWVNSSISKISQRTTSSERAKDFILASSGGSFPRRFMNMLGVYDDHTEKANKLGANLLGAFGGSVKSDKEIEGVGGPIPMDELDKAIEQVEKEFFRLIEESYPPVEAPKNLSVFETNKLQQEQEILRQGNDWLAKGIKFIRGNKEGYEPPVKAESISELREVLDNGPIYGDDYIRAKVTKYEGLNEDFLPMSKEEVHAKLDKMTETTEKPKSLTI
jgi:hypothetical protein